jgi:hypothetical protein
MRTARQHEEGGNPTQLPEQSSRKGHVSSRTHRPLKKLGLLTTVLTFSPSHCKFAGRKAEPPFLLARQALWEMTAGLTAREGLVTEQRPPVPLLLSRMFRRLPVSLPALSGS